MSDVEVIHHGDTEVADELFTIKTIRFPTRADRIAGHTYEWRVVGAYGSKSGKARTRELAIKRGRKAGLAQRARDERIDQHFEAVEERYEKQHARLQEDWDRARNVAANARDSVETTVFEPIIEVFHE